MFKKTLIGMIAALGMVFLAWQPKPAQAWEVNIGPLHFDEDGVTLDGPIWWHDYEFDLPTFDHDRCWRDPRCRSVWIRRKGPIWKYRGPVGRWHGHHYRPHGWHHGGDHHGGSHHDYKKH